MKRDERAFAVFYHKVGDIVDQINSKLLERAYEAVSYFIASMKRSFLHVYLKNYIFKSTF